MNYLALDVGVKRIGLAVGSVVAFGRGTITGGSTDETVEEIGRLINDEKIDAIILGFPATAIQAPSTSQTLVETWRQRLAVFGIPVYEVDEAFSSLEAIRQLRNEGVSIGSQPEKIDERAAQIILEQFINEQARS